MKFLSQLDAGDRKLLLGCGGVAILLAVLVAIFTPRDDSDQNPLPSSYLSSRHGALAAYETLERAGYPIERWERPLSELAATAGPETIVVFAQPFSRETDDVKAVRQIIEKGGRVLATGFWGGYLLPGGVPEMPPEFTFAACRLEPEGLDPLAGSGEVWMVPQATWQAGRPSARVQYTCAGHPAVVEYDWGKGHVIWWASSTPLENASLSRAQNLDLLLNSLDPHPGQHIYWDESLHGDVKSNWSYASGPALTLLRFGIPLLALLALFSFSRRSGPVRELPSPVRTSPLEFITALGSLYRSAGAASTAVAAAYERFRRHALRLCGLPARPISAEDLAATLRRRIPHVPETLEADLAACEAAAADDTLRARDALRLVQMLAAHEQQLASSAKLNQAKIK